LTYLDKFLDWLCSFPDTIIYLLLGLSAFVENICPPIPGDTITAFGAFLVGTQKLSFLWVYFSTTLGSLAGFMSLFWLGNLMGKRFFIERDYRFFKARDIIRGEEWLRKHGGSLVLFNRFFPGIRSIISIATGISKLPVFKVAFLALISCAVWNLIWIWLGFALGSNWDVVKHNLGRITAGYNLGILILFTVIALLLLIRTIFKRR
jgi:membrane protein DedA with SNARE-associated domain